MCRIVDLRGKEVINIRDGARLGFPVDIEFDRETGRVNAIVVLAEGRYAGLFGKGREYVVPWEGIRRVGDDIVLVDQERSEPTIPPKQRWLNR
ncbi:MAG: YlmC/YmxH family sporulation protein [Oscillospiraceae bacterium]|nr:YlmC/YmxH family sporulation protein [Oscillospiraceae bacterium]